EDMTSLSAWTNQQFDPRLNWNDVEWIKKRWGGKLVLKGILDVEDARIAADTGADAIIVSNHGGRQLDGAMESDQRGCPSARGGGADRRGGGQAHRSLDGWRCPLGPGRAESGRAGRKGHDDRPRVPLWLGRAGRRRRHALPRNHPQGTRHHDGVLRQERHPPG